MPLAWAADDTSEKDGLAAFAARVKRAEEAITDLELLSMVSMLW